MEGSHFHNRSSRHRDDLTGEHRLGDAGQAVFALLFLAVWSLDSLFLKFSTFPNIYVPLAIRIPFGLIFLFLSVFLAREGLKAVFRDEGKTPAVIREGVFGRLRHPIYFGEVLLYLAFLFFSVSLAAAVIWLAAVGFLFYISRYEEKLLLERFGKDYADYMKDVPMWILRLRRK
jgi:protein-S-isoprenylcysteine O-methyltransferase Ste14